MNKFLVRNFNLVEIILAMGIIVVAMTTLMGMFPLGMKTSREAVLNSYVTSYADQIAGHIEARGRQDWASEVTGHLQTLSPTSNSSPIDSDANESKTSTTLATADDFQGDSFLSNVYKCTTNGLYFIESKTQANASTEITSDVSTDRLDKVASLREIVNNDQEIDAYSLWAEWDVSDNLLLRSITAYRELDSLTFADGLVPAIGDYSALGLGIGAPLVGVFDTQYEQFSQELQLLGNTDHWDYVVGLYYFEDKATQDATDSTLLGVTGQPDLTETKNESYAIYGESTWNPEFMDRRWQLTLGARYARDERQADRNNQSSLTPFTGQYDNDFDNFNPSVTIAYDLNDDINVYGKIATGYKSGGTSTRSANSDLFAAGFEEEDIISYEVGFKGALWDGRARLNSAVFYMELDGLQTSVQTDPLNPGGRDFLPIDGNEISGFEADVTLLLTEGLTLTANYGYLDTKLGEDSIDSPAGTFELTGDFGLAPEHSYSLAVDYYRPLALGSLGINMNYGWQDDINQSPNVAENSVVESYGLLGAAVSWSNLVVGDLPGRFRMLLWGKNLTDEEYGLVRGRGFSPFGVSDLQTFGDPRTYGVTLSYEYE